MSLQNCFPQGSYSLLRANNLRGLPARVDDYRRVRTGHLVLRILGKMGMVGYGHLLELWPLQPIKNGLIWFNKSNCRKNTATMTKTRFTFTHSGHIYRVEIDSHFIGYWALSAPLTPCSICSSIKRASTLILDMSATCTAAAASFLLEEIMQPLCSGGEYNFPSVKQ